MHALNKPQFDQVECHMPHKLLPVPRIIQPELAARVGLWTTSHLLQEMFVPTSSIKAIFANKMARILLNPDLGRKGYAVQPRSKPMRAFRGRTCRVRFRASIGCAGTFDADATGTRASLRPETHRGLMFCTDFLTATCVWRRLAIH